MTGALCGADPATKRSGRSRVDDVTDRLVTAITVGEHLPGSPPSASWPRPSASTG